MFVFAPLRVPADAAVDDPSTFDEIVFVGVARFSHGHTPFADNASAFILAVRLQEYNENVSGRRDAPKRRARRSAGGLTRLCLAVARLRNRAGPNLHGLSLQVLCQARESPTRVRRRLQP